MKDLTHQLVERIHILERVIQGIERELPNMPEGRLNISKNPYARQFYQVLPSDAAARRVYLHANEKELVRQLGQKDYLLELLKTSKRELDSIRAFLKQNLLFSSDQVYQNLNEARQSLVRPILVDNDTYADMWQKQPYEPNPGFPEHLIYSTKRGELVRSKAESIFADMYFEMGIPYKYDYPIKLANKKTKYVDFALLNIWTRQTFYHEHLGRLDDPGYLLDNMQKLDQYREVGIFVGKNLILTHEIDGSPLNMKVIRQNMKDLFGLS